MKKLIDRDIHVCTVVQLPVIGDRNRPGVVVNADGEKAYFLFEDGRDVVAGDRYPELGQGKHSFLWTEHQIVAFVKEVRPGHFVVTGWAHKKDFDAVKNQMEPKPAPVTPPVLAAVATATAAAQPKVQVVPDRRNHTGPDRRQKGKLIQFEQALAQASAETDQISTSTKATG